MPLRTKALVVSMFLSGAIGIVWAWRFHNGHWLQFALLLAIGLLAASWKVVQPDGSGTMSVNFPFIFLGILELSPIQVILLTAASVFAQCRIHVVRKFTLVQTVFNVSNGVATVALSAFVFGHLQQYRLPVVLTLSAAAIVYFFANTVPVALAIAWSKGERAYQVWRHEYPWYLPFYFFGAVLVALAHQTAAANGRFTPALLIVVPLVYTIYRVFRTQSDAILQRQRHLDEMEAMHLRTIEALAIAVEAKDQNTHEHLSRVKVYVSEIGNSLALDPAQMKALITAAYLHDIGKLAIPEHILNKPGKLTREEFEKMKTHTVVGGEILERARFPYPVVPIVRAHHECWDGSGYPDGLVGAQIPIGARILATVDCFDALVSNRPYRAALSLDEAMDMMRRESGTRFDPMVIDVLNLRYREIEALARSAQGELAPLHTEIRIEKGAAPSAGLASEDYESPTDHRNLLPNQTSA
jgi:putative nucleotidyltransferase with HDIG domain